MSIPFPTRFRWFWLPPVWSMFGGVLLILALASLLPSATLSFASSLVPQSRADRARAVLNGTLPVVGKSADDVLHYLGRPESTGVIDGNECSFYPAGTTPWFLFGEEKLFLVIHLGEDGQVVKCGEMSY